MATAIWIRATTEEREKKKTKSTTNHSKWRRCTIEANDNLCAAAAVHKKHATSIEWFESNNVIFSRPPQHISQTYEMSRDTRFSFIHVGECVWRAARIKINAIVDIDVDRSENRRHRKYRKIISCEHSLHCHAVWTEMSAHACPILSLSDAFSAKIFSATTRSTALCPSLLFLSFETF